MGRRIAGPAACALQPTIGGNWDIFPWRYQFYGASGIAECAVRQVFIDRTNSYDFQISCRVLQKAASAVSSRRHHQYARILCLGNDIVQDFGIFFHPEAHVDDVHMVVYTPLQCFDDPA